MEDRPDEPSTAVPLVRIQTWGGRALLVCSILLLAACAPARLADLPDRPAGAAAAPSDDETRQQAVGTLREAFLQRSAVATGRQPIAPTFVPKATRLETVHLMLSISDMGTRPYKLEEVYGRLDPSVRAGAERLRAIGAEGDVEFRKVLKELANSLGACMVPIERFARELRYDGGPVVIVAPMKGERRIVEKALTHYLGDVSLVQDLVRGSVAVDHPVDVRVVADRTLAMLRQQRIDITEIEDHFTNTSAGGYRDFQINFRLPGTGVIGELQLHVKDLLVVKQRVGHGVYERARLACAAMEMGITNTDVSAVCTRNAREMAASYDRAYRRSWSRPRIHFRSCVPSSAVRTLYGGSFSVSEPPSSTWSSSRLRPMPQPARAPTPALTPPQKVAPAPGLMTVRNSSSSS